MVDVKAAKGRLREEIWEKIERLGVARYPLPLRNRIPNFEGSEKAAEDLRKIEEWKGARVAVANPDFAQRKVRELALKDGKTLVMASPRLRHGYLLIDPSKVKDKEAHASTISGAFKYGKRLEHPPRPDLIVTGCVAVDKSFYRLGKGGGYGDTEIRALHQRFGKIPVVTTVHDLQVVEEVPKEEGDTKVDIILTPTRILRSR